MFYLFLFAILPFKADAYLDPGTGSYVFQIAIASLLGILFTVKSYWLNIKTFIKRKLSKDKKETDDGKR